jgi:hypothetical protein
VALIREFLRSHRHGAEIGLRLICGSAYWTSTLLPDDVFSLTNSNILSAWDGGAIARHEKRTVLRAFVYSLAISPSTCIHVGRQANKCHGGS